MQRKARICFIPACSSALVLLSTGLLSGCTGGNADEVTLAQTEASPSPSASASPSPSPSPTPVRQVYSVQLAPSNTDPENGSAAGFGRVVVDGRNVGVYLQLTGLAPNMQHIQHIHAGTKCPDMSADTNGDGFIDAIEGELVSGPPLYPLGLGTSASGATIYPVPSPGGLMTYIGLASIGTVLSSPSPSPRVSARPSASPTASPTASPSASATPGVAGLPNLENHVIEIHGISPSTQLPNTVRTDDSGQPATATLPVACGTLVKLPE